LFTKKGDLVLDPFMGSGTTVLAARKLSRDFLGIEFIPEYVELAKKRVGLNEGNQNDPQDVDGAGGVNVGGVRRRRQRSAAGARAAAEPAEIGELFATNDTGA
jgi:hypothetical protein